MLFLSRLAAVVQIVGTSVSCLYIVTISEYVVLFAISVIHKCCSKSKTIQKDCLAFIVYSTVLEIYYMFPQNYR